MKVGRCIHWLSLVMALGTAPFAFAFPPAAAEEAGNLLKQAGCLRDTVSEPPFYISSAPSGKTEQVRTGAGKQTVTTPKLGSGVTDDPYRSTAVLTEPFSTTVRPGGAHDGYLVRGSIVVLQHPGAPETLAAMHDSRAALVQVRIISRADAPAPVVRDQKSGPDLLPKQDVGYLPNQALEPMPGSDLLILKKDVRFFSFGDWAAKDYPGGSALQPITAEHGLFVVMRCVGQDKPLYLFQVYDPTRGVATGDLVAVSSAPASCPGMQAVSRANFDQLRGLASTIQSNYGLAAPYPIQKLEINEYGDVRIPIVPLSEEIRAELGASADEVKGMSPDGSMLVPKDADPEGIDDWGKPDAVCNLLRTLTEWQANCRAFAPAKLCRIQRKDMACLLPGVIERSGKDPNGHASHRSGRCVDLRMPTKDGRIGGMSVGDADYNRDLTRKFLEFLKQRGAGPIYFGDEKLVRELGVPYDGRKAPLTSFDDPQKGPPERGSRSCAGTQFDRGRGVLYCAGHADHIHTCFPPDMGPGCGSVAPLPETRAPSILDP